MNDRSNLQLILTSFPSPPPPLFLYFSPPAIICLVHNINGGKIRRREGIGGGIEPVNPEEKHSTNDPWSTPSLY